MLAQKSPAQADRFADRLAARSTLSANRSNNSFATATNLGLYRGGSGTVRASGSLSKSDPVDYFKFQVAQGASWSSGLDSLKVRSGGVRVTLFVDSGSGLTRLSQTRYPKGSYPSQSEGFSNYPATTTFYLKFDRSQGTTRYRQNLQFFE